MIPRWTSRPVPGSARHPDAVPPALRAAVDEPMLRAAWLRVVGWLTGDSEVTAAYSDAAWSATLSGGSWRSLIAAARPAADRGDRALVLTPDFELVYDTACVDAEHVARVAGYLTVALTAMAADPDARYDTAELMSEKERRHLLHGLGGPRHPLSDRRFHELFAEVAARQPDEVAVSDRGQVWTYRELDRAANAIAHGLVARGLAAEEVVAVATGRDRHWLAAIIGIFKAGGAYLPVDPRHPPARIAGLLEQSRCRLLITAPGGLPALAGIPAAVPLPVDGLLSGPAEPPEVKVGPDRLAYTYFTSGSTGRPKGAMCEHAGMLNHLYAKIDVMELGPDDVVAQNAEATFDISLWQLIASLLVGGRTVIVPREEILDVRRFRDAIVAHGVTVLQVVPSYLELLLHQPGDLGAVRRVCVTGEAVNRPLAERFFAVYPDLVLVNAYGATELSDDTTHEVMAGRPAGGEVVSLGRPARNVTAYVLGPGDSLRPLGSVGEIAFAGVSVGRGYIGDPERTAEAFAADPFRPGQRMYRTGDFGRWLPDGSLEFHGRRDEQVKVNGIRIELGEVESRILEHPEVRTASVVAVPLPGGGKSLVGWYTAANGLAPQRLRAHLARVLPANAVPDRLIGVDVLPLTGNGKVDKRALITRARTAAARVGASTADGAAEPPATPTERRLARAWAAVLDRSMERIGRHDHFFDSGGGSMSALRLVAELDGLVSLDQLIRTPVLSELAAVADGRRG